MNANRAVQIISAILILMGVDENDFVAAARRDGSVTVVGLTDELDAVLVDNAQKIWENSAKLGSAFILEMVKGFPTLTNRAG